MTAPIKFLLDGREVAAEPGETIWQVAQREGCTIPHLCYKEAGGLRADGNCRSCVVEIEGERALAASCSRMPEAGMRVTTDSGRVQRARTTVAELLRDSLPGNGSNGFADTRFGALLEATKPGPRSTAAPAARAEDSSHPAIVVNMNACILCKLCIKACREVQGHNVIGLAGRGADTRIVFDFDVPMGISTCVGCGACVQACPTGALSPRPGRAVSTIDQDKCVECEVCGRAAVCAADALHMPELQWPRSLRGAFSNPFTVHKTGIPGRGTEEMKTNDVTHRFERGEFGVGIEMGRPGVSASFRDVEKVAMAIAGTGVEFETENPVTSLMVDLNTGRMDPEVLDERVLSAIIEFKIDPDGLKRVLQVLKEVAPELETVFSLAVTSRADANGSVPTREIGEAAGYAPRINGKTNVGLGRMP